MLIETKGVVTVKKLKKYFLPILLFIILTIFRVILDFNDVLYSLFTLFIILSIPIIRLIYSKKMDSKS